MSDTDIMLASEVARLLGKSSEMVRVYANRGRLPYTRTEGGVRLFRRVDVLRLAESLKVAEPMIEPIDAPAREFAV